MNGNDAKMYQKDISKGCACSHGKSPNEFPMNYPMHQCRTYKSNNFEMDEYPMDDFNSEGILNNGDCLDSMPLGMAYVPWQRWNSVYDANQGIQAGTIFPELELPFMGSQCGCGMRGDRQWK